MRRTPVDMCDRDYMGASGPTGLVSRKCPGVLRFPVHEKPGEPHHFAPAVRLLKIVTREVRSWLNARSPLP